MLHPSQQHQLQGRDKVSRPASTGVRRSRSVPRVEALEPREVLTAANRRLVTELYQELLQRPADTLGLNAWSGLLDEGKPISQVVNGLTSSKEYRQLLVNNLYRANLSRTAEAVGLQAHVAMLEAGRTAEEVAANLFGSPEYFEKRGGTNNTRFLNALYQDVLGRVPDGHGLGAFGAQLASGISRLAVAGQVLHSEEGRQQAVRTAYRRFLYRDPETAGLDGWVGLFRSGARQEAIYAGVLQSPEYQALASRADAVLDWNRTLLHAIRTARTAPPAAARHMAMVHAAVYDAVNAITRTHAVYKITAPAAPGTSAEAAAAAAAHRVLVNLYPAQTALFDAELALSLATIAEGTGKTDGITLGRTVADGILNVRANDGSSQQMTYTPGTDPGDWQRTPPGFLAPVLPQWPSVTPFTMTGPAQFRPPTPPALADVGYATDFNEVKELGRKESTTRTLDQTQIALFWADGPGTVTPPGHWNLLARHQAQLRNNKLAANARLFALLNLAAADAGIVAWECKYTFEYWRPVTAIQRADLDGNERTIKDESWEPLLVTPPFPTYTSGHSTFSAAAGEILTGVFGSNVRFTDSSDDLPGVYRSFTSFAAAAEEAGKSRIYGGIHFEFDNSAGLSTGRALGTYILQNYLRPVA